MGSEGWLQVGNFQPVSAHRALLFSLGQLGQEGRPCPDCSPLPSFSCSMTPLNSGTFC